MSTQLNKRQPRKMKKPVKVPIIVFAVLVALIAVMIIGIVGFLKFYRPTLDTDTPFTSQTEPLGDDSTSTDTNNGEGAGDDTKYVRNTNSVNFLVIGQDLRSWKTDVMMLVNFDMEKGGLSILQIPRDTYVNDVDIRGKINNLMYKKSRAAYDNKQNPTTSDRIASGMSGAVEFFEQKLCVQIDGYALVNLEGFRNVVDIIGGVPINVPYDMKYDDPDQNLYIDLKAGEQILDGAKAEMFVRFRSDLVQGDIGRGDAQKIFLTALFKELINNINISTIPQLVGEAIKHVHTDLDVAEIIFYVKELTKVDMANVSMMTLPGEAPNNAHYVMRRVDVLGVINEYFNVYDKPITDEMFDSNRNFTDADDEKYLETYNMPSKDVTIYTADQIDSDGIYIPRTHKSEAVDVTEATDVTEAVDVTENIDVIEEVTESREESTFEEETNLETERTDTYEY